MNPRSSVFASFAMALASVAVAFVGFASLTSPGNDTAPKIVSVVEPVGMLNGTELGPILCEPAEVLAVRRFPHDKRQPRPPRHRSDRASSYVSELELAASVIDSITHDDLHQPLIAEFTPAIPLAGHPLELLRPPSICA